MKVLLLTTHMNRGGIGIYTLNLAKYLRKAGVDAVVASGGGDLEGQMLARDIPHVRFDLRTKAEWGPKMWRCVPGVVSLVRDEGFDMVHAQTRVAQVLACITQKITGVPYISTCHGFFKHRRIFRRMFPCWGEKVIAISDSVQEHLRNDFGLDGGRIVRIYNGIELGRYLSPCGKTADVVLRELGISEGSLVVGSIGRLSPVKGYRYLVEAFGAFSGCMENARLLLVGEGPEKGKLEEQVRDLGLADKVIMTPGGGPLEEYLSVMDVFCLPSVSEGLGLSLMEAMAAGRACVASDVGGISELVTSGEDGLLVPAKDPSALREALARLAGDEGERRKFGENARKKAAGNFSIDKSVELTARLYREVTGRQ